MFRTASHSAAKSGRNRQRRQRRPSVACDYVVCIRSTRSAPISGRSDRKRLVRRGEEMSAFSSCWSVTSWTRLVATNGQGGANPLHDHAGSQAALGQEVGRCLRLRPESSWLLRSCALPRWRWREQRTRRSRPPNFGGPDSVPKTIEEDAIGQAAECSRPAFSMNTTSSRNASTARTGFSYGVDYSAVYLDASDSPGEDDSSGGMIRFYGTWDLVGRESGNTGTFLWKIEHRHSYGTPPPEQLQLRARQRRAVRAAVQRPETPADEPLLAPAISAGTSRPWSAAFWTPRTTSTSTRSPVPGCIS